jgi:hypothetical protein
MRLRDARKGASYRKNLMVRRRFFSAVSNHELLGFHIAEDRGAAGGNGGGAAGVFRGVTVVRIGTGCVCRR